MSDDLSSSCVGDFRLFVCSVNGSVVLMSGSDGAKDGARTTSLCSESCMFNSWSDQALSSALESSSDGSRVLLSGIFLSLMSTRDTSKQF
jgi:hypothetical protein